MWTNKELQSPLIECDPCQEVQAIEEHIKWSNRGPLHQISKLACHEINSCQDWNNNNNEKSNRQAMQFSIFAVQRKKHLNGNWVTV